MTKHVLQKKEDVEKKEFYQNQRKKYLSTSMYVKDVEIVEFNQIVFQ